MFKYIFLFFMGFNLIFAQETNSSKPTELEVFLFKVGFESLLKDVKVNSEKTKLNEKDVKELKEKVEVILNELYKNKNLLSQKTKSEEAEPKQNEEIALLKEEIVLLKKEIALLKGPQAAKTEVSKKEPNKTEVKNEEKTEVEKEVIPANSTKMTIASNKINVYEKPTPDSKVIGNMEKNDVVYIESCNDFGWCKVANKEAYIKKFLIKKD